MNFAPYQDQSPEIERAFSPPPAPDANRAKSPPQSSPPVRGSLENNVNNVSTGFGREREAEGGRVGLGAFETSLPLSMDIEAMLAYLLLPPAGGVFLLITEHKSDYVRFHAWQSSMLFTAIFIIHMIFSWSSVISWLLLVCDICLIAFLAAHAYRDVDTLEHFEVPFFGRLANSFVDNE